MQTDYYSIAKDYLEGIRSLILADSDYEDERLDNLITDFMEAEDYPINYFEEDFLDAIILNGASKLRILLNNDKDYIIKVTWDKSSVYLLESEVYSSIKDTNIAAYFAPSYYIGEYEGCYIEIQKRINFKEQKKIPSANNLFGSRTYKTFKDAVNNIYSTKNSISLGVTLYLINNLQGYYDIRQFMRNYNINDIHGSNFILTKENRIIIYDYSGYKGE